MPAAIRATFFLVKLNSIPIVRYPGCMAPGGHIGALDESVRCTACANPNMTGPSDLLYLQQGRGICIGVTVGDTAGVKRNNGFAVFRIRTRGGDAGAPCH
jgi:hypothetical protein